MGFKTWSPVADDAEDGEKGRYPAPSKVAGDCGEAEEGDEHRGDDDKYQSKLLRHRSTTNTQQTLTSNTARDYGESADGQYGEQRSDDVGPVAEGVAGLKHLAHAGLGGDGDEVGGGEGEQEGAEEDEEESVAEGEGVEVGCYYACADSAMQLVCCSEDWEGVTGEGIADSEGWLGIEKTTMKLQLAG